MYQPPFLPQTGPPEDITERQSPFWCVTVTEKNTTDDVNIAAVEVGLLQSYLFGSQKPRTKRSATDGTNILQIARLKINPTSYDFTYYLKSRGNYVPARTLRDVLRRLTRKEMSLFLGLQVKTLADTYFDYEAANSVKSQRLWLFFLLLTGLVILVLVIAFVLCCYINCLRPQPSPYWMVDVQHNRLKHVRIHPLVVLQEIPEEEAVNLTVVQTSAAAVEKPDHSEEEEEEESERSQTSGTNVSSSAADSSDASSLEEEDSDSAKASERIEREERGRKVVPRSVDEDSERIWKKSEKDSDAYDSYKRVRDPNFQEGVAILARLLNQPLSRNVDVQEEENVRVIEVPLETVPVTTKPKVRTSSLIERDILKLLNTPTQPKPAPFLAPSIEELPSSRILPLPLAGSAGVLGDFSSPAWLPRTPADVPTSHSPVTKVKTERLSTPLPPRSSKLPALSQEMPVQPTSSIPLASNPILPSPSTQSWLFPPSSSFHRPPAVMPPPPPPEQTPVPLPSAPASSTQTIFVVDTCRSTMTRRD